MLLNFIQINNYYITNLLFQPAIFQKKICYTVIKQNYRRARVCISRIKRSNLLQVLLNRVRIFQTHARDVSILKNLFLFREELSNHKKKNSLYCPANWSNFFGSYILRVYPLRGLVLAADRDAAFLKLNQSLLNQAKRFRYETVCN